MTRISIIKREEMDAEQGKLFDAAKAANRPVGGPYWAYIRNPKLMGLVHETSACLGAAGLTPRERQIAILTIARFWGAKYPWAVQVRTSLAAGVEQSIVDAINARTTPQLSDPKEKAAYDVATELLAKHGLSDATYKNAEKLFGAEKLVALVATVGQFSMTCCTVNAFDVTPPDDAPSRLLP